MFRFRFSIFPGLRGKTVFLNSHRLEQRVCRFVLSGGYSNSISRFFHITRPGHNYFAAPLARIRCFASYSTQKDSFSGRLWRVVKGILTFTGGVFWVVPVFLYGGYLAGFVQVDVEERDQPHSQQQETAVDRSEFQNRILDFYDIRKEVDKETRSREVREKDYAFMKLWTKLRNEEGVLKRFGKPVRLSAFHVPERMPRDVSTAKSGAGQLKTGDKAWKARCQVEGPQLSGLLEVEFSLVNNEWIPVSLQLEGLQKSGDIICNVSAPLPNGLTRFTRLSND